MSLERNSTLHHRKKRQSEDPRQQDNFQYHQFLKVISKMEKRILQLHLKHPSYPELLENYSRIFEVYDSLSSEFLLKLQFKGLDGLAMVFHRLLAGMKLIQNQFLKTTFEIYRKNVYIAGDEEFLKQIRFEEMSDTHGGINQETFKKYQESFEQANSCELEHNDPNTNDPNLLKIVQQDGSIIEVNNETFNYNFYISRLLGKKNDILDNAQYSRCKQLIRRVLLNLVQTQQSVQQAVEFEENMAEVLQDELENMDELKKDVGQKRRQAQGAVVVDQCVGCSVIDFNNDSDKNEQEIERDRQMGLLVEANYKLKKVEFRLDLATKEKETLKKNLDLSEQRTPQMEMAIRNLQMQLKNYEGNIKETSGQLLDFKQKYGLMEQKFSRKKEKLNRLKKDKAQQDEDTLSKELELKQFRNMNNQINKQLKQSNDKIKEQNEQISKLNDEIKQNLKQMDEKFRIKERIIKEMQQEIDEEKKKLQGIEKDQKGKRPQPQKDNLINNTTNNNSNNNNNKNIIQKNPTPNNTITTTEKPLTKGQKDISPQKEKPKSKNEIPLQKSQKSHQNPPQKSTKHGQTTTEIGVQIFLLPVQTDQETQAELRKECTSKAIQVGKKEEYEEGDMKELERLRRKQEIFIGILSEKEIEISKIEAQLKEALQFKEEKEQKQEQEESKVQEENNENQRIIIELNTKIDEFNKQLEIINKRKNSLKKKNKSLFTEKQSLEESLSKLHEQFQEISKQNQETKELYISQLDQIDKLREKKVIIEEENQRLFKQIEEICQEKDKILQMFKLQQIEYQELKERMIGNQSQTQITQQQQQLQQQHQQQQQQYQQQNQTNEIQQAIPQQYQTPTEYQQIQQTEQILPQQDQNKIQQIYQTIPQQNNNNNNTQQIQINQEIQTFIDQLNKEIQTDNIIIPDIQQNNTSNNQQQSIIVQSQQIEKKDIEVQTTPEEDLSALSLFAKKYKTKGKIQKNDYYLSLKQNNSSDCENTIDVTDNYSLFQRQQKDQSKSKIFNFSYEEQQFPRYSYPKLFNEKYLPPMDHNNNNTNNTNNNSIIAKLNQNSNRGQNFSAVPSNSTKKLQKQLNFSTVGKHEQTGADNDDENEQELIEIYHSLSKQFENQKLQQLRNKLFPEMKNDFIKERNNKIKSNRINDLIHLIRNQKTPSPDNNNNKNNNPNINIQQTSPQKPFPKYTEFRLMMHEMKLQHKEKCGEHCPHLEKFYKLIKEANENHQSTKCLAGIKNISKLPAVFVKKSQYEQLIGSERSNFK